MPWRSCSASCSVAWSADAIGSELSAVLERATVAHPGRAPGDGGRARRRRDACRPGTVGGRPRRRRSMGGPARNPYKGLRAFEEADAADFVGREGLVSQLVARMADQEPTSRMLAVVGPSGSGKSSVVSAGLVPALRTGRGPGLRPMVRGPHDARPPALRAARAGAARAWPSTCPRRSPSCCTTMPAFGRRWTACCPMAASWCSCIDQFEELFTLSTRRTAAACWTSWPRTLDDPASRVHVVITLRADFYDRPLRHERFGAHLAASTIAVPPMTPGRAGTVGNGARGASRLRLEPGLVARIVAEMSEQPGSLPLLQYALSELWERRDGARLSLSRLRRQRRDRRRRQPAGRAPRHATRRRRAGARPTDLPAPGRAGRGDA